MARFRRDLALAALLLVAACTPERAAAPSPSPTVSVAPSASPSATASPVAPTVIGVFGDWGIRGGRAADVVRLMNGWRPLHAVLTTGDNAYGGGRPDEAVLARDLVKPLRDRGVPLYASLGNHDVYTDNGRHVIRELSVPGHWYTRVVGSVEIVVLDSNRPADARQMAFLRSVLLAPRRAAFRVAVFHHPLASCSLHDANRDVERAWFGLFHGRIDLALAGHNHTYERFMVGETPYVTTGGGGARLYPSVPGLCKGPGTPTRVLTVYHALRLTATPERLLVEAVGLDGVAFDTVAVSAP